MNNVPNFDAMEESELEIFYRTYRLGRNAKLFFPNIPKSEQSERPDRLMQLAHYALYKSQGMRMRREGNIQTALHIEKKCDRIYAMLPSWAKW